MKKVILAAFVAGLLASPSAATMLRLTFSGTVSSGSDNTGVFGGGNDLTGEAASLQFNIDTTLGTRTDSGTRRDYIGGFFYPAGTPVVAGAVTVGGVTHLIDFPIFGELLESVPPDTFGDYIQSQVSQLSENQTGPVIHFDSISAFSASASNGQLTPHGFDMPFTYTPTSRDNGSAMFTVFARDIVTDEIIDDAEGSFTPTFVRLEVLGGVPEPATWATMLAGFGAIGGAMRSRRKVTVAFT